MSYEQNQHFAELRQNVCLYTNAVVPQRDLPSLDGKFKFECFVTKIWKKQPAKLEPESARL